MKNAFFILLLLAGTACGQTALDFAPLAPVVIQKPDGRLIPYGSGASTDDARGNALEAAVAASVAGDIIRFGPGDFDTENNQLDLPADVSLIGAGTQSTWIINGRDAVTNGATVVPGDNSEIAYFSFDTTETRPAKSIGSVDNSTANDKDSSNVYIHHIHFKTQIDGVHIVNGPSATDNAVFADWRVEDCTSYGAWDFVATSVVGGENCTITATLRNNKATSIGTLFTGEVNVRCVAASASSGSTLIKIYNDDYTVSDGTTTNHGIFSSGSACTVEAYDCRIRTSGTGAADLYQASSGTLRVTGGNGSGTGGAFITSGTITFASADRAATEINNATAGTLDGRKLENEYRRRVVTIPVSDFTTALTTGDGKNFWRVPAVLNGWDIVGVAGHVTTVSSSGVPTFSIYNVTDSVDVLSTALTIDANEKDSATALNAAVINTSNDSVATADEIRIDCDTAGTGTLGASVEITLQEP